MLCLLTDLPFMSCCLFGALWLRLESLFLSGPGGGGGWGGVQRPKIKFVCLECPAPLIDFIFLLRKILLPSAVHLEERLTVSQSVP